MENKNYEWVELPSKGQCYPINSPLREGKVKVSYLTAMDENIIVSEKHIKDRKICDVYVLKSTLYKRLSRKIRTFALSFGKYRVTDIFWKRLASFQP